MPDMQFSYLTLYIACFGLTTRKVGNRMYGCKVLDLILLSHRFGPTTLDLDCDMCKPMKMLEPI